MSLFRKIAIILFINFSLLLYSQTDTEKSDFVNDIYNIGSILFNNYYSINLYKNNEVILSISEFNELFDLMSEFRIYQFEILNNNDVYRKHKYGDS